MPEPERVSNAREAALTPNERRDLILATLQIQKEFVRNWGRDASVIDVLRILGEPSD